MAERRVLYVCHNHPSIRPGGVETYALELYEGMREHPRWAPILLARSGPPYAPRRSSDDSGRISGVEGDPNQYLLHTGLDDWNWLLGAFHDKTILTEGLRQFLLAHRPDVVHFHHTLFMGYDAIRLVRNVLPQTRIVYTLHEFLPICHRGGQLLRTGTDEPCLEESPRRCHECFPDIPPDEFFLRKRWIQSQLALVDRFIAPSRFLLERYVDWGIPRTKLCFEDYGRRMPRRPAPPRATSRPTHIGFFGQLSPHKGVNVLLAAMEKLSRAGAQARLWIHGTNLDLQSDGFQREFRALLADTGEAVTPAGAYGADELPSLMANVDWVVVPSLWWENSPLVIQEAFLHGRPVICSDIGGMAEKVADGVSGLHFRAGDPESLARVLARAVDSRELWRSLRAGIPNVHAMDAHVRTLSGMYEELLEHDRARRAAA